MFRVLIIIVFVLLEFLALVSCGIYIYAMIKPCLFRISTDVLNRRVNIDFGVFGSNSETITSAYKFVTGYFRFIQVMAVTSTVLAIISFILGILGFFFRKFGTILGGIIFTNGVMMIVFDIAYSVQYLLTLYGVVFIFKGHQTYFKLITYDNFQPTVFLFVSWPMSLIFLALGGLVMAHSFKKKRTKS
ncbi:hypothetical protein RF11_15496 [Thelohanellus kitauei]|uniref:Uncharacterized protein n=1 Tax=Thelohanellus kitauei TaxID=669202 RepID=A0A0C2MS43_THEKT|nr:hypothetical protein RF11_15496 [Thelohanellus kitauei]